MIEVGQQLYFVPSDSRRGSPFWVTVGKVGRKWAAIDYRMRIDIETLDADGGVYSSPGRCYISEEDYLKVKQLREAWHHFRRLVNRAKSPDSIDKIREAAVTLGIDLRQSTS